MNFKINVNGPRSYRVSTQIRGGYGLRLEMLQSKVRSDCGKRLKICELIEMGIDELEHRYEVSKQPYEGELPNSMGVRRQVLPLKVTD